MSWWQDHFEAMNPIGHDVGGHGPIFGSYMDAMRYQLLQDINDLQQLLQNENKENTASDATILESLEKAIQDTVSNSEASVGFTNAGVTFVLPNHDDPEDNDGTANRECEHDESGSGFKGDYSMNVAVPPAIHFKHAPLAVQDMTLEGSDEAEVFTGGKGSDTVAYLTAENGLVASLENPDANTGDAAGDQYLSIENLTGSNHSDVLGGNDTANTLAGGRGNDILYGGGGNDILQGGDGHDWLYGGEGDDQLKGGADSDLLFGDQGNDVLHEGKGDDLLFGDEGNDVLKGSRGNDLLYGGKGDDIYLYTSLEQAGDVIFFDHHHPDSNDSLHFSADAFTHNMAWSFAAASLGGREYDGQWGDQDTALFLYDTDSGTLWHDFNAAEAGGQTQIAQIWGSEVEEADIVVV